MLQSIHFDAVAEIYDDYVTADFDIPFFLNETKKVRGKVLELMCGTGRVSIPLLQAGVDLSCVDHSTGMLAVLQRKLHACGLSCPVHCMDVSALALPDRFDLILIPFHSFSEILGKQRQEETLRRIHAHLTETGRFLCTLQNPTLRTRSVDGTLKTIGEFSTTSGSLIVRSRLTRDSHSTVVSGTQLYEMYDRQHRLQRAFELDIHFCLHTKGQFEEMTHAAGFAVDTLYGDYSCAPFDEDSSQFMIWQLRKSSHRP